MVRLVDIARQAGVSVMTVSRVLRDAPDISEATKVRVRAIAQQLGYVPDVMARSLRTRSTRLLGAVVPAVTDPVFGPALRTIEERAQEAGFDLLVAQSLGEADREDACLRRLLARRVEGLFLGPAGRLTSSVPIYDELRRRGARMVLLGPTEAASQGFVQVGADEAAASQAITSHLLALGHRRIVFLAGPPPCASAQARFVGYRRALRAAGLDVDDRLVFRAGLNVSDGAKALERMLAESVQATAVQAVNDLVAVGAMAELLQRGYRVPGDISVAGFGNLFREDVAAVPLTTVRQPKHRLGVAALDAMMAWLRGERPERQLLPAELVVRASTAPPDLPGKS